MAAWISDIGGPPRDAVSPLPGSRQRRFAAVSVRGSAGSRQRRFAAAPVRGSAANLRKRGRERPSLPLQPVVRRLARDRDIVDVALAQPGVGDAAKAAVALHL